VSALAQFQRVVLHGTGVGSEIWQTGFSVVSSSPPISQASLQVQCDALVSPVTTWWNAIKANISTSFTLTGISMYAYSYPTTTALFQAESAPINSAGTLTGNGSPIDTALVISLRTGVPGRSQRGRMYVPFHGPITVATGLLAGATATAYNTATKALFDTANGLTTNTVSVISRTHGSYEKVKTLLADNKPDVQRRRENRLAPSLIDTKVLA
jgi:hypothetical protein